MALPVVRHQDAPAVGMSGEIHAEHVEDFPFEPVGRGPHRRDRRDRLQVGRSRLDANAVPMPGRVQTVDKIKSRRARRPVGCRHVGAEIERRVGRLPQVASHVQQLRRFHDDSPVTDPIADVSDRSGQRRLQRGNKRRHRLIGGRRRLGGSAWRRRLWRMFGRAAGGLCGGGGPGGRGRRLRGWRRRSRGGLCGRGRRRRGWRRRSRGRFCGRVRPRSAGCCG